MSETPKETNETNEITIPNESPAKNETKIVEPEYKLENKSDDKSDDKSENKYAVLMETNGEECESWLYFIKYNGNEKNLTLLQKQLESIDWYILDDLSTFDLDLDHFVSSTTAKEMTKIELNHYSFHRKFDGVLTNIDLNLRKKDKNEKKMVKVFDILGYGQIEDFVDEEDIDPEDLTSTNESSSEENSEGSDSDSSDEEDKKKNKKIILKNNIPLPRFALKKRRPKK